MTNAITLTDIAANRIFAADRANAQVPVAGTVTITSGTPSIQAQVIEAGDIYSVADIYAVTDMYNLGGTVVVAWTTIVANPVTGAYSGTISVPLHSTMLMLQVRLSDLSASANGSNSWGAGYIVLAIGQSNMQNMWLTTGNPAPPDSRASYYFVNPNLPPQWGAPGSGGTTGDGMIAFMNALIALVNAPVGAILGAVGGTALDQLAVNPAVPLEYWMHLGGNPANYPQDYLYQATADAVTATGADICAIIWLQGEQECASNFGLYALYQSDTLTLAQRYFALCPLRSPGTNLFFHVGIIGFFSGTGAAVVDGIRNAQIQAGLSGGGMQLGPCTYDAPMLNQAPSITVHHTAAGYVTLGHRWAMQVAYWLGTPGTFTLTPGTSPRIVSAARQGTSLLMTVVQPPNGAFLLQISPGIDATGFTFSVDNFVTTLTPAFVRQADVGGADLTQIVASFAADPGAPVQIRHQAGNPASFFPVPSVANLIYGGRNPPSEPVGLPLQHIGGTGTIVSGSGINFYGVPVFPNLPGLTFDVVRAALWTTNLQENISKKQFAISYQQAPLYRWELSFDFLYSQILQGFQPDFQQLLEFFNARLGRNRIFLYQDQDDFQVAGQLIGIGDGARTVFPTVRSLPGQDSGDQILAPNFDVAPPAPPGQVVNPTAGIKLNNVPTGTAIYSPYGTATQGNLTFSPAPSFGVVVTADFWYYWPCRFEDDTMTFTKFVYAIYNNKKVAFRSVNS